ncbi:DUF4124 domain-containing protein [Massilia oculi]|uniref:DUF4124 domain-containing protein n=1 Tax=Massilia hydrophila TaxID=3044279 RepID=A0ABS7Y459_9BURK|nr:DUF4124 domain-containing protein [Massilia oculi]MCA1854441.1 DUF4124 domain-containing protein [Massilia oculi]
MAHRTLGFAALFLAGLCQAQTVYKVVGPDGKIGYTDRPPPPSAHTVVTTLGRAAPQEDGPARAATQWAVDASLRVYYKQIIVHSAKRLCGMLASDNFTGAKDAAAAATRAASTWEERHAALTRKKIVVVQDALSDAKLNAIADDAKRQNEPYVMRLSVAPIAERVAWCKAMPTTLTMPEFDLAGDARVVRAIMDYVPRK